MIYTENCQLICNTKLSGSVGRLVLSSSKIAPAVLPGQFVHLQIPGQSGHILRRPFSVYDTNASKTELSIVYQVVGQGTELIFNLEPGCELSLLGPIGNGWAPPVKATDPKQDETVNLTSAKRVLLVGGGIGAAPLMLLAKQLVGGAQLEVVMGALSHKMLVFLDDYREILPESKIHICTDDGSAGTKGYTTTIVSELLGQNSYDYIASCGPEPMQVKIAQLAQQFETACEVSLEKRMACGLGACLSCVVQTAGGQKRVCVDGPVFAAKEVFL